MAPGEEAEGTARRGVKNRIAPRLVFHSSKVMLSELLEANRRWWFVPVILFGVMGSEAGGLPLVVMRLLRGGSWQIHYKLMITSIFVLFSERLFSSFQKNIGACQLLVKVMPGRGEFHADRAVCKYPRMDLTLKMIPQGGQGKR